MHPRPPGGKHRAGIALAYGVLAEADLAADLPAKLFNVSLPARVIYSVVSPKLWSNRPKIATFRRWVLSAAAAKMARSSARGHLEADAFTAS